MPKTARPSGLAQSCACDPCAVTRVTAPPATSTANTGVSPRTSAVHRSTRPSGVQPCSDGQVSQSSAIARLPPPARSNRRRVKRPQRSGSRSQRDAASWAPPGAKRGAP